MVSWHGYLTLPTLTSYPSTVAIDLFSAALFRQHLGFVYELVFYIIRYISVCILVWLSRLDFDIVN